MWPSRRENAGRVCAASGTSTGAFVIPECHWVHTLGMKVPIDVAFVDEAGVVIKIVRMRRWRLGAPVPKANWLIEARPGRSSAGDWQSATWSRCRDGDALTVMPDRGRLVLVATPIGNLGDLSPRAVEALTAAELICCEDTRRTGRLLQHAGIAGKRLAVCNEHTERERVGDVLAVLGGVVTVAVVTDAGTPGISDPGERLARATIEAGFERVDRAGTDGAGFGARVERVADVAVRVRRVPPASRVRRGASD